jgi:D-sedoheptulose 7-phosphate isomerase
MDILKNLINRFPELSGIENDFNKISNEIIETIKTGGTLFLAGNGGSACDCEHLAGELLKGFHSKRPLNNDLKNKFINLYGKEGEIISNNLQQGIKCISLLSHPGFNSAFANDVDASLIYAQQLLALGNSGDVIIGFSTSGNSKNICKLFMTARVLNIKTILFTGNNNGKAEAYSDYVIRVPETETYKIQELHLPIYHSLALIIEQKIFGV